jgi:heme/copper-type cytochrome/quinol oxidase subunit 2
MAYVDTGITAEQHQSDWMYTNIFTYAIIIISIFIFGVLVSNAVYFRRIADAKTTNSAISKSQATNMFYLNLLMALGIGIIMIFSIIRAIIGFRRYNQLKGVVVHQGRRVVQWAQAPAAGVPYPRRAVKVAPAYPGQPIMAAPAYPAGYVSQPVMAPPAPIMTTTTTHQSFVNPLDDDDML